MYVAHLTLHDFRSYADLDVALGPGATAFIGRNGQGKTNLVESLGYDGLVVEETKDDPFVVLALASTRTTTLGLGTSVAIAFPRSPTTTAMSATIPRPRASRGMRSQSFLISR